jgi:hypothetical protein
MVRPKIAGKASQVNAPDTHPFLGSGFFALSASFSEDKPGRPRFSLHGATDHWIQ